jgi:hypothetical protein
MGAFGRLWRRAPAWRLWLMIAIASTGLAVLFPPSVPKWLPVMPGAGSGQGMQTLVAGGTAAAPENATAGAAPSQAPGASQPVNAHFAPQPDLPPLDSSSLEVLHGTTDRSGVIPFAGRQIPLPAGNWRDLVLVRTGGAIPGQREILARTENGQLTGLIQADAPSPASGAAGPLVRPELCAANNTILREVVPDTPDQNPMVHECWLLMDSDLTSASKRNSLDDPMQRALNRVQELGAKVPDHMLMLVYLRTDQTGWLNTLLLVPDQADVTAAASRRIQSWARHFAAALHQGYDGRIPPGGPPAAVTRDPT